MEETQADTAGLKRLRIVVPGLVMLAWLVTLVGWLMIPADAKLPVHWNIHGQVDRYGGRAEGLLMMPIIMTVLGALALVLPKLDPRARNVLSSGQAYTSIWLLVLGWQLVFHGVLVAFFLGAPISIPGVLPFLIGVLFISIGNFMGKVRSNFFVGVRTPWTLSSEEAWNRTNRLGGRLFVLLGALCLLAPVAGPKAFFALIAVGVPAMVIVLFVHSYLVWKEDKGRVSKTA